jgi:hypothetical protein
VIDRFVDVNGLRERLGLYFRAGMLNFYSVQAAVTLAFKPTRVRL